MIGLVDRIVDVEHRRDRAADLFAILDRHRAVWPLGHDLHRQPFWPVNRTRTSR